jgi:hypothetical protein
MPISKPDHVQVHRIEFAKGTNLPRLIDEMEKSIQSARYAAYASIGVAALGVAGVSYGLYKIGQGLGGAWEDITQTIAQYEEAIATGADATVGAPPVIGNVLVAFKRVFFR